MKKTIKLLSIAFFAGMIFLMSSCRPSTVITASWADPELSDKKYDNVLITALVDDVSSRQVIESELAQELAARGVNVSTSMNEFPPKLSDNQIASKDRLIDYIEKNNIDALITISFIAQDTETQYVPGNYTYAPAARFGYYGTFWGYYNYWYPRVYEPGYYTTDKFYFLETNLYDAETEDLVWSAQTETMNPGTIERFSEGFSDRIANQMVEKDLISTKEMAMNK